jgi:F0F1-type ATP synthase membrane subunit a
MTTNQNDVGLENLLSENSTRRRKLLPIWMKVFVWIFMIMGAFAPLILLFSASGGTASLALYGLETTDPYSNIGLSLCALFILKGPVAYGLWSERNWAVKLAIGDAVLGILICIAVTLEPLYGHQTSYSFRLELVVLIPYLLWLLKIKRPWERMNA